MQFMMVIMATNVLIMFHKIYWITLGNILTRNQRNSIYNKNFMHSFMRILGQPLKKQIAIFSQKYCNLTNWNQDVFPL